MALFEDDKLRLVWDTEALYSKDDDESWAHYRERAGISCAGVIDARTGMVRFFGVDDDPGNDLIGEGGELLAQGMSAPHPTG